MFMFHVWQVTMRLIANRLLPAGSPPTYVQGELVGKKTTLDVPRQNKRYHVYVSPRNAGGRGLMRELARANSWPIHVADELAEETLGSASGGSHTERRSSKEGLMGVMRQASNVSAEALGNVEKFRRASADFVRRAGELVAEQVYALPSH